MKRSVLRRVGQQGALQQRTIITPTAVRKADLVQDLYLQAIRAYKPTPIKPSDSEGHVQKFNAPKAPVSPEEGNISKDLKAYEDQEVEVEGQVASSETSTSDGDWYEEEEETETPSAH